MFVTTNSAYHFISGTEEESQDGNGHIDMNDIVVDLEFDDSLLGDLGSSPRPTFLNIDAIPSAASNEMTVDPGNNTDIIITPAAEPTMDVLNRADISTSNVVTLAVATDLNNRARSSEPKPSESLTVYQLEDANDIVPLTNGSAACQMFSSVDHTDIDTRVPAGIPIEPLSDLGATTSLSSYDEPDQTSNVGSPASPCDSSQWADDTFGTFDEYDHALHTSAILTSGEHVEQFTMDPFLPRHHPTISPIEPFSNESMAGSSALSASHGPYWTYVAHNEVVQSTVSFPNELSPSDLANVLAGRVFIPSGAPHLDQIQGSDFVNPWSAEFSPSFHRTTPAIPFAHNTFAPLYVDTDYPLQSIDPMLSWNAPLLHLGDSLSPSTSVTSLPIEDYHTPRDCNSPGLTADDSPTSASCDEEHLPPSSIDLDVSSSLPYELRTPRTSAPKFAGTRRITRTKSTSSRAKLMTRSRKRLRDAEPIAEEDNLSGPKKKQKTTVHELFHRTIPSSIETGWICPYPNAADPTEQCTVFFPMKDQAGVHRHLISHMAAEAEMRQRLNNQHIPIQINDYVFDGFKVHYECNRCGVPFSRADALLRHERSGCKASSKAPWKENRVKLRMPTLTSVKPDIIADVSDPATEPAECLHPLTVFPFHNFDRAAQVVAMVEGDKKNRHVVEVVDYLSYWSDSWGVHKKGKEGGRPEVRWLMAGESAEKFDWTHKVAMLDFTLEREL